MPTPDTFDPASTSPPPLPPGYSPRLWTPNDGQRPPTDLTLREAFERYILPDLRENQRKRNTIREYLNALRHWEAHTTDPAIAYVDKDVAKNFVRSITGPLAAETVGKVWRHLRPIFRRYAPAANGNPDGMGLIETVPRPKMPKVKRANNRAATIEEAAAFYAACDVATWPHCDNISPAIFWRAGIVFLWELGPRCFDLFCMDPANEATGGWRFKNVNWIARSIRFRLEKTSDADQPDEIAVPCSSAVMAHLTAIRSTRAAVLPVTKCRGDFYESWHKIRIAAGIEDKEFTPQCVRRACQTEFDWLHMGLGDYIVGHIPSGVGPQYYRNFGKKARETIEQLPRPPAFTSLVAVA